MRYCAIEYAIPSKRVTNTEIVQEIISRSKEYLTQKALDLLALRLDELRAEAASEAVMNRQEILETHSEIARGRIGRLLDDNQRIRQGADLTDASIQEVDTVDIKIGKGENAKLAQVTKIKLHDPVKSMQEIAKLQGYYPKEGTGEGTPNQSINFIIMGEGGKDLIEGITRRLTKTKPHQKSAQELCLLI